MPKLSCVGEAFSDLFAASILTSFVGISFYKMAFNCTSVVKLEIIGIKIGPKT